MNDAADAIGKISKKGVHPTVKRSAQKTLRSAGKYLRKATLEGIGEDLAYNGIYEFSSLYANHLRYHLYGI